ncbi:GDP-L-fucose synthase [Constrictibacter sp. MBR-5]|jgi:GDP-L-fucose synthase|uniref:GDP-L-fucose synthase n=1 Tax=Constrictibacter sp. MBR-5 TaxID=3156467 RepID=UPI0033965514
MTERTYDLRGKRVWVAGHRGMVGSALVRRLAETGCEILTAPRDRVDLRRQVETEAWMAEARPQAVFLAAARVGGILANDSRPADFIYDNLMIEANVIDAAWRCGVEKLLFLGSSCIYPRDAAQPIAEPVLLSGPLEPTNEWYAIAKIAGIKLCQAYRRQHGANFIAAMPTNLYGPGDTYDLAASHVIPALIAKMHRAHETGAATVDIWGSGRPRREFLYVDDLADALVWLMERYDGETHVNVGTGEDLSIADLARRIGDVVGFRGDLAFDTTKPDGTPRKLLDVSRLRDLGWTATTPLAEGLARTYEDFRRRGAPGVARPDVAPA